ncbi:MAG: hypothetical protein OZ922_01960 [Myxococcales bacterium]|nr:hypothetical protein [Myxococcales bacterium]
MSAHIAFRTSVVALAMHALLFRSAPAVAAIVGGGGSSRVDCLAAFDAPVNAPAAKPRGIRCADGDPACDLDGTVNGVCNFRVSVCANSTFNPAACALNGVRLITVEHAADNGDPKFDPEFQALQTRIDSDIGPYPNNDSDACTTATNFFVAIKGPLKNDKCKRNKKQIRLIAESTLAAGQGTILVDKDKLDLVCDPPVGGCDPGALFTGTYDRVQRQIFNQSCAVSGCHDSNSFVDAGNLLLEASAFPANLINRTPTNADANGLGWKRITQVDPNTGDPDTSFLMHKLTGDLPGSGLGARMPRGRPKLDATLINVMKLWIEAGAPDTGWVSGTD